MPESLYKLNRSNFTVTVQWANVRQAEVVLRQLRAALDEINQMLLRDKQILTHRTRHNTKPSCHFQSRFHSSIRIFPFIALPRVAMLGAKRLDELLRKRNALKLKIEHEIRAIEDWLVRSDM